VEEPLRTLRPHLLVISSLILIFTAALLPVDFHSYSTTLSQGVLEVNGQAVQRLHVFGSELAYGAYVTVKLTCSGSLKAAELRVGGKLVRHLAECNSVSVDLGLLDASATGSSIELVAKGYGEIRYTVLAEVRKPLPSPLKITLYVAGLILIIVAALRSVKLYYGRV
jgi:hypothetical protein